VQEFKRAAPLVPFNDVGTRRSLSTSRTEVVPAGLTSKNALGDRIAQQMTHRSDDMRVPMYQVDAFTSELFSGNPAAVCILQQWPDDGRLKAIAAENNLSETAFLVKRAGAFELRWFTPIIEVSLCGHATLASSFVVFNLLRYERDVVQFHTKSGILSVKREGDLFEMDFPAQPPSQRRRPAHLGEALGVRPVQVLGTPKVLMAVLEDEDAVRNLAPDFSVLARMPQRGTIVTATGANADFVSRYFAPHLGIPEDPVTGSSHCVLTPFWAERLGKKQLHAMQLSKRTGELFCEDRGPRVAISGRAVLYLDGTIAV
jgi:PhzF family phenazine biosynthesis protein